MATSTAQAVATVPVWDYLMAPGDPTTTTPKGLRGKKVKVTLSYAQGQSAAPVTLLGTDPVNAETDPNGFWQVNLVPNNKISPSGTIYTVEIEGYRSYVIQVTDVNAPAIGWQSAAIATLLPIGGGAPGYTLPGGTSVLGGLTIAAGETGLDTNSPGALVIGDNVATSIELGAPTSISSLLSVASFTAEPLNGYVQLGTGAGGAGNGATSAQILPLVQPTFLSGNTLAGSDTTHAVVAGSHLGLVGYYYVATGVAGSPAPNPSVPIISATFDGTNTTFVISNITGHTNGQTFEVSLFPGGTSGYPRSWDPRPPTVFKPTSPRTFIQVGPNTGFYQVDVFGTVYLIGFNGVGPNGDFFRDLRVGDLGVYAIENDGSNADTSPAGTEPPTIAGYLGYNGSSIKMFRDAINSPRTKSFEVIGTSGQTTWFASAASAGAQFIDSPRVRLDGTYWTGAASADAVAYALNHVIDATGVRELQIGFEAGGAGSGKIRSLTVLQPDSGIAFLAAGSADPGVAGVWFDGTETFLQATSGPIFLRTVAGTNNNALVGSAGGWLTKDGGGTTRNTLDDGSGNMGSKLHLYPGAEAAGTQTLGGFLHSTGVPSNSNGNNNDWIISDNGHLYFKRSGVWTDMTAAVTAQSTPGNPAGTASTAGVMMGLAGSITPLRTGNVLVIISGDIFNNTINDGGTVQIRTGTGTAPVNGAALTGTARGGQPATTAAVGSEKSPFSVNAVVSGLTLGTAVWIDLAVAAVTGGTATVENISISAVEV